MMKQYLFSLIICMAILPFTNGFAQSTADRRICLTADTVSLHFTVYKYFPFIDAEIDGLKGKLMFDTGAQTALEIDDKKAPQKNGKLIGKGFVGSGQSFETYRYDTVSKVMLDGRLAFTNAGPVTGHNFSYMDNITPGILGLVGYRFFEGYIFKLDYQKSVISFYKSTPQRQQQKDFLKNEKVIAVLDFELRKLPNHPVIPIVSQTDTIALSFDTGQIGTLGLTDAVKKRWIESGQLQIPEGSNLAEIKSFRLPNGLTVTPGKSALIAPQNQAAAKKAIGITEANSVTFGYAFLSQYKTVWDYPNHKIYLLQR